MQVVLLGSGLDTKAWRLEFPAGTAIFELDQRDMSAFKLRRLAASKAQTNAALDRAAFKHPLKAASWAWVATDLMHPEWVADLEAAGFQKGALPCCLCKASSVPFRGLALDRWYRRHETCHERPAGIEVGLRRTLAKCGLDRRVMTMIFVSRDSLKG